MTNPDQCCDGVEADRGSLGGFPAADGGSANEGLPPALPGALARALRPGYRGEGRGAGQGTLEREAEGCREVVLTLPYPLSANRYWASRVAKINGVLMPLTYVTSEAKAYKQEVAWLAKCAGVRKPMLGRVAVDVRLYPMRPADWAKRAAKDPLTWDDTVRCIDLDNARKVLYDALKGVVFEDDKWVREDSAKRMEPDGDARVVVTVRRIAPATLPQASLL